MSSYSHRPSVQVQVYKYTSIQVQVNKHLQVNDWQVYNVHILSYSHLAWYEWRCPNQTTGAHIFMHMCSCVQGVSLNTSVNLQLLKYKQTTSITQAQSVKHSADTRQGGNNTNMLRIGWRPPRDSLLPIDKLSQGFKQCCDVLSPPSYLPPPPPSVNNWHVSTFYANLAQDMPPLPRSCKSMPLLCSPAAHVNYAIIIVWSMGGPV